MWLLLEISFTLRKGRAELYFLKYKCTPYRYITVPFTASQFLYPYCTFKSTIMYPKCPKCTYKQRYNHWAENWENLCVTLFVFSFFFFFSFSNDVDRPVHAVLQCALRLRRRAYTEVDGIDRSFSQSH